MKCEILGDFGYVVEVVSISSSYVEYVVYQILTRNSDGEVQNTKQIFKCSIELSGAAHFWFGRENENFKPSGYLHIRDIDNYENYIELLKFLYSKTFDLLRKATRNK